MSEAEPTIVQQVDDPIATAIADISRITERLESLARLILVMSVLHVSVALTAWTLPVVRATYFTVPFAVSLIAVATSVLLCATVALYAYLRETVAKRGEASFQEVSDELEWHARSAATAQLSTGTANQSEGRRRPLLQVRIELRRYVNAVPMPMVPGHWGHAVYLVGNVILSFAIALIAALIKYLVN